jgi:hypothetical protein
MTDFGKFVTVWDVERAVAERFPDARSIVVSRVAPKRFVLHVRGESLGAMKLIASWLEDRFGGYFFEVHERSF